MLFRLDTQFAEPLYCKRWAAERRAVDIFYSGVDNQRENGMHTRRSHRVVQKFAASSHWFPIHSCSL